MSAIHSPPEQLPPDGVRLPELFALERIDRDLFRASAVFDEPWPLFGGQVAAQALIAAGRTVDAARRPHSLHGYYLRPGNSSQPVIFRVERDRDGGSFSARRVVALQDGEVILNLSASFARDDDTADTVGVQVMPEVTAPAGPTHRPPRLADFEQVVPEQPLPTQAHPTRVWLRCTADLGSDPLLDAASLTYLSDLYTGFGGLPSARGKWHSTIDHALWLHRPAASGQWVLMDLIPRSIGLGRGQYVGSLWLPDGTLVGSLAQETLYRAPRQRKA